MVGRCKLHGMRQPPKLQSSNDYLLCATSIDLIVRTPWKGWPFIIIPHSATSTESQRLSDLEKRYDELQKQVKVSAPKPAEKKLEFPDVQDHRVHATRQWLLRLHQ